MNRKQRRAEAFGHYSDSRKYYQALPDISMFIQGGINQSYREELESIKFMRIDNYFFSLFSKDHPSLSMENVKLSFSNSVGG